MRAILSNVTQLTGTGDHHAFTDLCTWRGYVYCGYRKARTHNILPTGSVIIRRWRPCDNPSLWSPINTTLSHPDGDVRDPKFLTTPDALYVLCGIYLPNPAHSPYHDGLSPSPGDNILQTHIAYTTDGETWSPLVPILRPNYWGWSGVNITAHLQKNVQSWGIAAYHTGGVGEASSIELWTGRTLLTSMSGQAIYEGASVELEGEDYRYSSSTPSEPVLWGQPVHGILGCCVRTEGAMALGYGKLPYGTADWRWHNTTHRIHPSAVLSIVGENPVLAGRAIKTIRGKRERDDRLETTTALWELEGYQVWPLLTLPSEGDTGYAGMCVGPDTNTILVSYYSTHEVPAGLPGAAVYIATVYIT